MAFSDDPMLAWVLSGRMFPEVGQWDLWVCNVGSQTSFEGWEAILDTYVDTGRHYVKEYRVYTRVYKRDLDYVGTRAALSSESPRTVKPGVNARSTDRSGAGPVS